MFHLKNSIIMAVRNLEAINRHGEMIAQQQNNAKKDA